MHAPGRRWVGPPLKIEKAYFNKVSSCITSLFNFVGFIWGEVIKLTQLKMACHIGRFDVETVEVLKRGLYSFACKEYDLI